MARFAFNPITGNLDLQGDGGGGGGNVTINTMDGGSVEGNDFFLEGQTYKTIPIVSTGTDSGDTIINNLTFSSVYIVDSNAVDTPGTFPNIQSALDESFANGDAAGGKIAHIQLRTEDSQGYFTENLSFADGSSYYLEGIGAEYQPTFQVLRTIVIGNHTTTGTTTLYAKNIYFSESGGFAFTGVTLQNFFFKNCALSFSSDAAAINCSDCLITNGESLAAPGYTAHNCFVQQMNIGPNGTGGGTGSTYSAINFDNVTSFLGYFQDCTFSIITGSILGSGIFAPKFYNCQLNGSNTVTGNYIAIGSFKANVDSGTTNFFAPSSEIQSSPNQKGNTVLIKKISADYALEQGVEYVGIDTSGGPITITFPDNITNPMFIGREYEFKDETGNANVNNVTIDGNGLLLDGQSTIVGNKEHFYVRVMFDGTKLILK